MKLTRDELMEAVRSQMPASRWNHTAGVMTTAVQLAEQYGVDPVKADLAALLHDVVKYWPTSKMEQIIREQQLPCDLLLHDKVLWHAPVGAVVAERDYGVNDVEILDAIRYHTSGRVQMTMLDKVICLADYMEPGRDFPGVNQIRELSKHNLEKALLAGLDSTISFLIEKGARIYPLTIDARNALIEEIKAGATVNE
ncbi:bis(5'-nucleosyl)-tetraphosphatase (symmetrical) YqeK [Paenibacillus sp. SC116]|uniref:bis(5'-nucleosyl)-tetraphosphatase (symmetrical) YqeK n=1 Tax=Paenibacillus sp. SC116 TaxID=2968986 RepID=UPI00215A55EF|nr:bis(5'-nucleosyl)-tetraphosphatase (symmetrical) YqeK [Paenibacillus sp. SC116]MCR8845849.1 bis(5'-nucleosyl)-tetraphosphatase (symmetrical) YqeK [Paenibacillus sp. SC116]